MGSEWLACLGQVCVGWDRGKLSSLGVNATVFQVEIFAVLACARNCTGEHTYICTDSQAAWQALEASVIMTQLVWEFCTLSSRNKVTLLWVPGHSGIQGKEDADTSTKRDLVIVSWSPTSISRLTMCWQAQDRGLANQDTLNTGWPLQVWDSQNSSLKGLKRNWLETYWPWTGKQCRLVTGMSTGHCTLIQHIHVTGLRESAVCRKCEQEEDSYQGPALAGHRLKIFGSPWVEPKLLTGPQSGRFWKWGQGSLEGI
jgi:hypothetical protein